MAKNAAWRGGLCLESADGQGHSLSPNYGELMATRFCKACQRAPREDDPMPEMRFRSDDWCPNLKNGNCVMICVECLEKYRPMLFEWLKAEGYPITSIDQVVGNWLM